MRHPDLKNHKKHNAQKGDRTKLGSDDDTGETKRGAFTIPEERSWFTLSDNCFLYAVLITVVRCGEEDFQGWLTGAAGKRVIPFSGLINPISLVVSTL